MSAGPKALALLLGAAALVAALWLSAGEDSAPAPARTAAAPARWPAAAQAAGSPAAAPARSPAAAQAAGSPAAAPAASPAAEQLARVRYPRGARATPAGPAAAAAPAGFAGVLELGDGSCLFGADARCRALAPDLSACDAGDAPACLRAAAAAGETPPRDAAIARALLSRACALGAASACDQMARARQLAAELRAEPEAVGEHLAACERGDAPSCYALAGAASALSAGAAPDLEAALCDLGFVRTGCLAVTASPEARTQALRRGCDLDAPDACYLLARHLLGDGFAPAPVTDLDAALRAYDRACALAPAHPASSERHVAAREGGLPPP